MKVIVLDVVVWDVNTVQPQKQGYSATSEVGRPKKKEEVNPLNSSLNGGGGGGGRGGGCMI